MARDGDRERADDLAVLSTRVSFAAARALPQRQVRAMAGLVDVVASARELAPVGYIDVATACGLIASRGRNPNLNPRWLHGAAAAAARRE